MFTGIVEEIGRIESIIEEPDTHSCRLSVHAPLAVSDVHEGDSISVDGTCLTVTSFTNQSFTADVMAETQQRTIVGGYQVGTAVNIERSLQLGERMGGHVVQGHVEATAEVLSVEDTARWTVVSIATPPQLRRYIVSKGSIAINGVSLTVVSAEQTFFTVSLIPTTLQETTFGKIGVGDTVNLEPDIIAKYVAHQLPDISSQIPSREEN